MVKDTITVTHRVTLREKAGPLAERLDEPTLYRLLKFCWERCEAADSAVEASVEALILYPRPEWVEELVGPVSDLAAGAEAILARSELQ